MGLAGVARVADDVVAERRRLVTTLRAVGPDAPTSIDAWRTSDVASHLAAQDRLRGVPAFMARSVVVATGLRLSGLYLDRALLTTLVNGPKKDWQRSLRILDRRPPSPVLRSGVATITLWEHFVHHEDVRRANGVDRDGLPDLGPVLDWLASYNRRRLDRTVRTTLPSGDVRSFGSGPVVTVDGDLAEVVLWLSGREADVTSADAPATELDRLRERVRA